MSPIFAGRHSITIHKLTTLCRGYGRDAWLEAVMRARYAIPCPIDLVTVLVSVESQEDVIANVLRSTAEARLPIAVSSITQRATPPRPRSH